MVAVGVAAAAVGREAMAVQRLGRTAVLDTEGPQVPAVPAVRVAVREAADRTVDPAPMRRMDAMELPLP